jgi:hypothetical protein
MFGFFLNTMFLFDICISEKLDVLNSGHIDSPDIPKMRRAKDIAANAKIKTPNALESIEEYPMPKTKRISVNNKALPAEVF